MRKRRPYIFVISVFLIGVIIFIMITEYFRKTEATICQSYVNKLQDEFDVTIDIYSGMADLLYVNNINTVEIKQILASAYKQTSPEQKSLYRRMLFEELSGFYSNIIQFNFTQLQFHEPDNLSFLRFNNIKRYGDDLTGVRYSVEYVNREKRKISGFEEGRILNGYRNVYPIFYNNRYLGSVEISVSMNSVLSQISNRTHQQSQFILLGSTVENTAFPEEIPKYIEWSVDHEFFIEKETSDRCILENCLTGKDIDHIKRSLAKDAEEKNGFSIQVRYKDQKKILAFIPVKNLRAEIVGYIFTLTDSIKLSSHKNNYFIISGIFLVMLSFLILFIFYYTITNRKIENMIIYDPLTKIYSRRMVFTKLEEEIRRYKRYRNPFCICMLDIDHFKQINDCYGHQTGDYVIKELCSLIFKNIRTSDSVGRYGGDEILLIFPETGRDEAVVVMAHIRKKLAETTFEDAGLVTISGGISMMTDKKTDVDMLIEEADKNLYKAKENGRDQIIA